MSNLIWMDMEMSGLDADRDKILEIASVVTDSNLNILAVGPELVIHHDKSLFNDMDEWNQTHHEASGLWQQVLASSITLAEAEERTLEFFSKYTPPKASPLCGNSIWQDRRFLAKHARKIDNYLHYRNIDVSSVKELVLRWYPEHPQLPYQKNSKHRAVDDVIESINEMKHYRHYFFVEA